MRVLLFFLPTVGRLAHLWSCFTPTHPPQVWCPCRIYYFWQNRRHWVCAHAEFITFGRSEGIGCVPMRNLLHLAELNALGVCPCRIYCFWQN